jgi:hypothetical protein
MIKIRMALFIDPANITTKWLFEEELVANDLGLSWGEGTYRIKLFIDGPIWVLTKTKTNLRTSKSRAEFQTQLYWE